MYTCTRSRANQKQWYFCSNVQLRRFFSTKFDVFRLKSLHQILPGRFTLRRSGHDLLSRNEFKTSSFTARNRRQNTRAFNSSPYVRSDILYTSEKKPQKNSFKRCGSCVFSEFIFLWRKSYIIMWGYLNSLYFVIYLVWWKWFSDS